MVRKDKEEVRSSSVSSAVSLRPRYQLGEKHHQIRAYILLYEVLAVRHLVRGFFPLQHIHRNDINCFFATGLGIFKLLLLYKGRGICPLL